MVFLAHRDAAAGQHHVVAGAGAAQGLDSGLALVGQVAAVGDLAAQALQQGAQKKAVAVVNGAGRQLLRGDVAGHDQLIARGEQRHARAACHRQAGQPNAGRQPERSRGQARTGAQHHGTLSDVFARTANVLPAAGRGLHAHGAIVLRHAFFLHDHGIGSGRHGRAGEDARRRAGPQGLAHAACGNALRHRQHGACSGHIGAAQGISVHGAVVEGGYLQGRHDVLRQHTAVGVEGRNLLLRERSNGLGQQRGQRLVQRHQRRAGHSGPPCRFQWYSKRSPCASSHCATCAGWFRSSNGNCVGTGRSSGVSVATAAMKSSSG